MRASRSSRSWIRFPSFTTQGVVLFSAVRKRISESSIFVPIRMRIHEATFTSFRPQPNSGFLILRIVVQSSGWNPRSLRAGSLGCEVPHEPSLIEDQASLFRGFST